MTTSNFFIQLVIILISARLLGELAAKFSIPSVIGELLAGVILGPSLLNWIPPAESINLLAEIGIVLLLFEVGIESDISKLVKAGGKASLAALAGMVAPFIGSFIMCFYLFDLDLFLSLFVGCTFTATSIGVTLRVLSNFKRHNSHEAQIILGAAIIDDIIGIILLSILYEFSIEKSIYFFSLIKIILFVVVFLVTAPILVKWISNIIKCYESSSSIPGLLPTMTVALLLLFAWLSHTFGAPELLGGFAAGLALSPNFFLPLFSFLRTNKEFSQRVENNMKPIVHLFVPIFFVHIGLSLDLRQVVWQSSFFWCFVISILLVAIMGKLASGCILTKETTWMKWVVGIAMIPRGEVGLIFAEIGRVHHVFNQEIYAAMVLVIAITTILAPIALRFFYTPCTSGPFKSG